jgi:hypothetical protein
VTVWLVLMLPGAYFMLEHSVASIFGQS